MTTANKITLTRIAMIPFFIYFAAQPMLIIDRGNYIVSIPDLHSHRTRAVLRRVVYRLSDGYVARKYNQVTDFGKFVDPLADKLLVASALILFVEQKAMAGWMVCVILARELIITSLRVVAANKGVVMAATWTGKVKTCVQIGGIIVIYLHYIIFGALASQPNTSFSAVFAIRTDGADLILTIVGWVVTLVTIYSGYDYLRKNWDLIKDGAVKAK